MGCFCPKKNTQRLIWSRGIDKAGRRRLSATTIGLDTLELKPIRLPVPELLGQTAHSATL